MCNKYILFVKLQSNFTLSTVNCTYKLNSLFSTRLLIYQKFFQNNIETLKKINIKNIACILSNTFRCFYLFTFATRNQGRVLVEWSGESSDSRLIFADEISLLSFGLWAVV